jgi:hypothetical protein
LSRIRVSPTKSPEIKAPPSCGFEKLAGKIDREWKKAISRIKLS